MMPNAVGENKDLTADWSADLSDDQKAAYIRYQYISLSENVIDWDDPAHVRHIKKWDGPRKNGSAYSEVRNNNSAVWYEILRRIKATEAEMGCHVLPAAWVHAHFSPLAERRLNAYRSLPEIRPSSLHQPYSAKLYTTYISSGPALLINKYELAADTINLRLNGASKLPLSDTDKLIYVLGDEAYVTATPFFRHAFAAKFGCIDAVEQYLWAAAIDFEANQVLYERAANSVGGAWWFTEPLIAAVSEIRTHWRCYRG